ncbi:hypothetical protein ACFXTI_005442 [Malus domestica]
MPWILVVDSSSLIFFFFITFYVSAYLIPIFVFSFGVFPLTASWDFTGVGPATSCILAIMRWNQSHEAYLFNSNNYFPSNRPSNHAGFAGCKPLVGWIGYKPVDFEKNNELLRWVLVCFLSVL